MPSKGRTQDILCSHTPHMCVQVGRGNSILPHNSSYSVGGVMRCSVAIQKFTFLLPR